MKNKIHAVHHKPIDFDKLHKALQKLIPNYSIEEDNDGQIIIYTNLKEDKNGNYKEMK
jgi:hypothetical protein